MHRRATDELVSLFTEKFDGGRHDCGRGEEEIHIPLVVDIDCISHVDEACNYQGMDVAISQFCKGARYQNPWNLSD